MKPMRTVVLETDLYHPRNDPNDHWNLACMYSLAMQKQIRFGGILCDEDKPDRKRGPETFGDPAVGAIHQLGYITGVAVPMAVGSNCPVTCEADIEKILASGKRIPSVQLLTEVLERAEGPVDIHICGSSRDVLLAARMRPDLFAYGKVRIFLNAGTYEIQEPLEYNVKLEPYAYSQIFELPCEILWAPCFHALIPYPYQVAERANYFFMEQKDSLPYVSDMMKNYFLYMLDAVPDTGWLSYIQGPVDQKLLEAQLEVGRPMWSLPGYLMSADRNCDKDGRILEGETNPAGIYGYEPVEVACGPDGILEWKESQDPDSRVKMFRIRDLEHFQDAMISVVRKLLEVLP